MLSSHFPDIASLTLSSSGERTVLASYKYFLSLGGMGWESMAHVGNFEKHSRINKTPRITPTKVKVRTKTRVSFEDRR